MRKLVLSVILLTLFITKTNSQEINLNGFTFNIPSKTNFIQITNLDQVIGFNFMFPVENGQIIDIPEAIDDHLKDLNELGIFENDKMILIGKKEYLEAYLDHIHDYKLLKEKPNVPNFRLKTLKYWNKCSSIKDDFKNMKCRAKAIKNHHEEFQIIIQAGSSSIEELNFSQAELKREITNIQKNEQDLRERINEEKKNFDEIIQGKTLSHELKLGITKTQSYYELYNSLFYSDRQVKELMQSGINIITSDGKYRLIELTCNYKKCKKPKKLFDNIVKQFLQKEESLIEVNFNNNQEIKEYINIVKRSYKSYKFAKYLLLLL